MITNLGNKNGIYGSRFDFIGLSTDTKPENGPQFPLDTNSLFLELDTNDLYYYTGETWAKVGG